MKPGAKFAIGAVLIVGSVSLMIVEGVKTTGTYFLTPTQLAQDVVQDTAFYHTSLKVSAKVVPGSIRRDDAVHRIDFSISDGTKVYPVTYSSPDPLPDTFTDANDIDVVVEGKLGRDGTFKAVDVLAKCGSRYDAAWQQQGKKT